MRKEGPKMELTKKFVLMDLKKKFNFHPIAASVMVFFLLLNLGCVADSTTSKNRGKTTDYSITTTTTTGCGTSKYILVNSTANTYSCYTSCPTNYHTGSSTELASAKTSATTTILALIESSAGICVADSAASRPTGTVYVSSDYCSCLNGKSDIVNDCSDYCAGITSTTTPTLHLSVTLGSDVADNTKLGNLYNWCNVQLDGDTTSPQCFLTAWDGTNTIDSIPVTIPKSSNTLTADLSTLSYGVTYVVKIYEGKTGSNASSSEFQIRRVKQSTSSETTVGALKITPISQYTCLTYGGTVSTSGVITRTSYARIFYYYPANDSPNPIASTGSTQSQIVCHDENTYGTTDNILYPRLELIPAHMTFWDYSDARFVKTNSVLTINTTIQNRLSDEYGITQTVDLFSLISYPNRPNVSTSSSTTSTTSTAYPQGYIMVPFTNSTTSLAYCPTSTQYKGTNSLFKIMGDYMTDTEGLYLGEKEAESIDNGDGTYKTVYGTMFVTETILKNYGFYVSSGIKVKASSTTMHNKTIYYYWPVNTTMDPLVQGDRKLFTVRYSDQLNGNTPTGTTTSTRMSDKRIGCIPITSN
jgi:hypothetical protein